MVNMVCLKRGEYNICMCTRRPTHSCAYLTINAKWPQRSNSSNMNEMCCRCRASLTAVYLPFLHAVCGAGVRVGYFLPVSERLTINTNDTVKKSFTSVSSTIRATQQQFPLISVDYPSIVLKFLRIIFDSPLPQTLSI